MVKRIICVYLAFVLCVFVSHVSGEGLLPSLSKLEDVAIPSLGAVLHTYPFYEETDEDGVTVQHWFGVSEGHYNEYSRYLSDQGVSLVDYSTDNNQMTVRLIKDDIEFSFEYIPDEQKAIITYPSGAYDPRSKAAEQYYNEAVLLAEKDQYTEANERLKMIEDYQNYKDALKLSSYYSLAAYVRSSGSGLIYL